MTDIWTEALRGLQPRLGRETYDLWLRPLELVAADEARVRLRAPSQFMKEWFENHYLAAVLDEMRTRVEELPTIEIEVVVDAGTEAAPVQAAPAQAPPPASPSPAPAPAGLADRYRFDTFITGASNELAASAAAAVAEEPGQRFNPLLLYGGVGLGKTHLLHAVGHAIHENHPQLRVVYLSAERFMNEFISAVRYNQFDEFRQRYREDCDVLLIDDIQFIAGRDRTMDEFFHVFNALYEAGKQIMVTADRTPSDMQGMEERLTSRLNWGLVADVKAPDLETRVAILRQKAEQDRIAIPDDVCVHLATLVRSNVRELEGALVRVATFASLKGKPITEAFVREVLGETAEAERRNAPITVEAVQKAVAQYFSVRIADLKGQRRHKGIARPRMIAMYLSRELTGASFPEIGLRFGGKDHSTVINACRRMSSIQEDDPELRATIHQLRAQLIARP
ncbi:chromosomal replication initiator protein DnaA [Paraliomyxa miuraensis]|uniref:chromosomal replication initiator protein DnaA n=1 Tax=Paraliomyxa miuraensis TaxID=376150 RepID=UPI002252ADE7|nr:chromosomal replication initiator protein DnaA [Paraliomyxa miuraensis]MCX4244044.1 chromosomal replication initiator protein DnaA [Paraliomyxa miuraensis]